MTKMPTIIGTASSDDLKYDAWNRLVEVKNNGVVVQANQYDGLNRRIKKSVGADFYDYYYNQQWQVLEVRKNGSANPWKQYVYHPHYVDSIAVRYYDEDTDGLNIDEHYYLQDANFNVTAVVDNTGTVKERYAYTPYGEVTILDDLFTAVSGNVSTISNEHLYTGRRLDPETGLQLNRNRFYASHLGRWVNRDPIGYEGSQWNLYEYVNGMPLIGSDPFGLFQKICSSCDDGFRSSVDICDQLKNDLFADLERGYKECQRRCNAFIGIPFAYPACMVNCAVGRGGVGTGIIAIWSACLAKATASYTLCQAQVAGGLRPARICHCYDGGTIVDMDCCE